MINLHKADRSRQNSIVVDKVDYLIKTEFHWWVGFGEKLKEIKELTLENIDQFDYLYVPPFIPDDKIAGYKELEKFFINDQVLPHKLNTETGGCIAWDYLLDSERINDIFLSRWGIDLETSQMHWHRFTGLFYSYLWPLDKVMKARGYEDVSKKSLKEIEAYNKSIEERQKNMWEIEAEKKEIFKMR